MIRVLFVCLGNICRSPMAEAIFRHKVTQAGLAERIVVDSAGTGDWHIGHPPHEGTRKILKQRSISDEGIRARQVAASDFESFDYIVAMDDSNVSNLQRYAESHPDKPIYKMMDFVKDAPLKEVPDPYYTGNFEQVYSMLDEACDKLLGTILEREAP
jgi:protein-tyrosine phosphatase